MASSSPCLLPHLLLCIAMVTQVASRPSPKRATSESLQDRLGADITLFLTHPEMVEGGVSVESSTPSWNVRHSLLVHDPGAEPPHAGPRLLLDFLNRQKKLRGRSRKSSARGCFGMKVDRIGALSGMGC